MINDGVGKVCRWDGCAETAAFSTCLFYCLKKHEDKYVRIVAVCFLGFLGCFSITLPFAPILLAHSGFCPLLQSCPSLLRCFVS